MGRPKRIVGDAKGNFAPKNDEDTMRSADYIVDIGPGAGEHGGEVVAEGTLEDIIKEPKSITGQYLSGEKYIQQQDDLSYVSFINLKNEERKNPPLMALVDRKE